MGACPISVGKRVTNLALGVEFPRRIFPAGRRWSLPPPDLTRPPLPSPPRPPGEGAPPPKVKKTLKLQPRSCAGVPPLPVGGGRWERGPGGEVSGLPRRDASGEVVTREGQPEGGHLLVVAHQQDVAGQHRVVPGLALDCRDPCELRELIGGRLDQRQLPLLRQDQQQVLVGQHDELAVAVASAFPIALAVL